MALEDILSGIDNDTKRKIEEIGNASLDEAKAIRKKAEEESDFRIKATTEKAESDAKSMEQRELSKKKMELKKEYYNEIGKRVSDAKTVVESGMDGFRKGETYSKLMDTLYNKIVDALGEDCTISVREDDKGLISGTRHARVTVSDMRGGIVGESRDGSLEVDYSLENIMRIIDDEFTSDISDIILGESRD